MPGCGDRPRVAFLHQLPYFMNELTLTELDMGTSIPSVLSASNPTTNDRGRSPIEWQEPGAGSMAAGMEVPAQSPEQGGFNRHTSSPRPLWC